MKTFKKSINAFLAAMMLISASSIGISAANPPTQDGDMVIGYDTNQRAPYSNGSDTMYTVLIPKRLDLTGDRTKDKFTVALDTDAPFELPDNYEVTVKADKVAGTISNGTQSAQYRFTPTASTTIALPSNLVATFDESGLSPTENDIYVYFNPDDIKVPGKYTDVISFEISATEKTAPSEEAPYLLDEPMVPIE